MENRASACCGSSDCRPIASSSSPAARSKGEEQAVLHAFGRIKATMPNALLVIAPRAPERFGEVERLSRDAGFSTVRRSELPIDAEPRADVVVLDSIGELAQLYQMATAVFVGGSLVDHGGHNILEPAVFGKPIVFGPHMHNFQEIAGRIPRRNGAAVQVQSERELDEALLTLVSDPVAASRSRRGGARARRSQPWREEQDARRHCRAPARPARRVTAVAALRRGRFRPVPLILRARLQPTASSPAWRRARYLRRSARSRRRLDRPVISVGNLGVGGSGKTPVVEYLARRLLRSASGRRF